MFRQILAAILTVASAQGAWKALTRSERGYGPAVAQQVGADGAYRTNRFTDPARPGETLVLWGSGLVPGAPVRVYVAGRALEPSFAAQAPGQSGIDQINVTLPEDVLTGCFVPFVVESDAVSEVYTVAIGWESVCRPEVWFFDRRIEEMDTGGRARVFMTSVRTEETAGGKAGVAEAWIAEYDLADAAVLTLEVLERAVMPACSRRGRDPAGGYYGASRTPPTGLSLTGNNGCQLRLAPGEDGVWRAPLGAECVPTSATVDLGTGGRHWTSLETNLPWSPLPALRIGPDRIEWQAEFGAVMGVEAGSREGEERRRLYCGIRGARGNMRVPDLPWALGLAEPSLLTVRRQGFAASGRSGGPSPVDFDMVHIRHELAEPF